MSFSTPQVHWKRIPLLVLLAAALVLAACSPAPEDEIVGKWQEFNGARTFEFRDNGTVIFTNRAGSQTMNYRFLGENQVQIAGQGGTSILLETEFTETERRLIGPDGEEYQKQLLFDWRFARRIFPDLLDGMQVTIKATFVGFALAMVFGLAFALGRRSPSVWVSNIVGGVVEFIRSTPLLVQLFFFFYVLPRYGLRVPAFTLGVLALGLHYGTYTSEVYRAGIEAVPRGQWEAATALNFSRTRVWTGIILPQALPPMFPAFGNYLIAMFKETALLSSITIVELMLTATTIGKLNFRFVEPITIAGFLYFLVSYPSSLLVQRLEARYGRAG